ncbi:MAG: DUF6989 domain-containing protein [Candidatus Hodarchaeales archaeon]
MSFLEATERDFLVFHALFAVLCGVVLLAPLDLAIGIRMFGLVVIYNILIPGLGFWRRDENWLDLWYFAIILSVFQVFPDWFLVSELDVLAFPDDNFLQIGEIPGYMAGLWAIPLFIIIFWGQRTEERHGLKAAYPIVALSSLAIFGLSEATMWALPAWSAQNVTTIGHVALYILIPEVMLGLTAFYCYQEIQGRSFGIKLMGAFLIMLLYLGSASFFYFLFEKILLAN